MARRYSARFLVDQEKAANSGGCVADTKQEKTKQGDRGHERTCKAIYRGRVHLYTIASYDGSIQGIIKEIDDGGMVIERNSGEREIINLDFVTRIREYPRKKNGKKKGVVLD